VFKPINMWIRLAMPTEITARRIVVVKDEICLLTRIGPWTPLNAKIGLFPVNTEDTRIKRNVEFPKPAVVSLLTGRNIDCRMFANCSFEFGQCSMAALGWRLTACPIS
jgi:hypothetical protein